MIASQLRVEERDEAAGASLPGPSEASADTFVGQVPRRGIVAGAVLRREWLEMPPLVKRGELVKGEVVTGAARLQAEGIAEASGTLGQMIPVQNPESKRRYRARVEAAGRVSVKGTL